MMKLINVFGSCVQFFINMNWFTNYYRKVSWFILYINNSLLPTVTTDRRSGICPNIDRPHGIPLYCRYNSFSPNEITGTSEALQINNKTNADFRKN